MTEIEILARVFRETAAALVPQSQQQIQLQMPQGSFGPYVDPAVNAGEQIVYSIMSAIAFALERASDEIARHADDTDPGAS